MKDKNKRIISDLHDELFKIAQKMTDYREKLIEMKNDNDPEAFTIARTLLENSMTTISEIEEKSRMLGNLTGNIINWSL